MQPVFGAQLPASAEWRPLTNRERWAILWKQDFLSPAAVVRPFTPALTTMLVRSPQAWPRNLGGLGNRFVANWANAAVQDVVEVSGASLLGQETRYISCRCRGFGPRALHAIRQTAFTYDRHGRWQLAVPRLAANYAGSAVAVYGLYPDGYRTAGDFWRLGHAQIPFTALGNMAREFLPEIGRVFRKKRP